MTKLRIETVTGDADLAHTHIVNEQGLAPLCGANLSEPVVYNCAIISVVSCIRCLSIVKTQVCDSLQFERGFR